MKRRLFNLAAAVSLGMMLAVIALWVSSYGREREVRRWSSTTSAQGYVRVWSSDGVIMFERLRSRVSNGSPGYEWVSLSSTNSTTVNRIMRNLIGFRWNHYSAAATRPRDITSVVNVYLPYWTFVVLTGAMPAWWFIAARRRSHRRRTSLCAICGYDLRATPDRCPECGTPAPAIGN